MLPFIFLLRFWGENLESAGLLRHFGREGGVGFALGVGVEGTAFFAAEDLVLAVLRFGGMAYVNGGRERIEIYV
jgi:hypothetical protein